MPQETSKEKKLKKDKGDTRPGPIKSGAIVGWCGRDKDGKIVWMTNDPYEGEDTHKSKLCRTLAMVETQEEWDALLLEESEQE